MILARIISFVFHPLLMATYLFGVFAICYPLGFDPLNDEATYWRFVLNLFFLTFMVPALVIGVFKSIGSIDSVMMKSRRERVLPFIVIASVYIAVTIMVHQMIRVNINDNLLRFLLVIDALVIVSTIVTLFFKVSVHSIAAWGFIGVMFYLNLIMDNGAVLYPTLISILLAGIIMSARLKLNVHTSREVSIGAGIGLVTSVIGMIILFPY
jgi:hypothetical protein